MIKEICTIFIEDLNPDDFLDSFTNTVNSIYNNYLSEKELSNVMDKINWKSEQIKKNYVRGLG